MECNKRICEVCGSDIRVKKSKITNQILCSRHYDHIRLHGKILERTIFDPNKFNIYDDCVGIELYNRENKFLSEAIIDIEDFDKVKNIKWRCNSGYVVADINNKRVSLHRFILNIDKKEDIVDHRDHNTLNNRKNNLRVCTISQNNRNRNIIKTNTSGVTGVRRGNDKWRACIVFNKKNISLGTFENFEDAVKARKEAEEKYFGEFSHDNSTKKVI